MQINTNRTLQKTNAKRKQAHHTESAHFWKPKVSYCSTTTMTKKANTRLYDRDELSNWPHGTPNIPRYRSEDRDDLYPCRAICQPRAIIIMLYIGFAPDVAFPRAAGNRNGFVRFAFASCSGVIFYTVYCALQWSAIMAEFYGIHDWICRCEGGDMYVLCAVW